MPRTIRFALTLVAVAFFAGPGLLVDAAQEPEPLFPIVVGDKWGLIDRQGRVVVEPRFDQLYGVSGLPPGVALMGSRPTRKGLIGVRVGRTWGFVGRAGEVIPPTFDAIGSFGEENLAPARLGRSWGFIDRSGQYVIDRQFDYARDFGCGLAEVQRGDKWGMIDTSGRAVVPIVYDAVYEPCFWADAAGHALTSSSLHGDADMIGVTVGRKMGYVNRQGEVVIAPSFVRQTSMGFREGLKGVRTEPAARDGYIDRTGRFVIPPQFDDANDFVDGVARVQIGGMWRYIDRTGTFVETPATIGFSDGRALRQIDGKAGFVDERGAVVIAPAFDAARPFHEGRAAVCVAGRWGFVDRKGDVVVELKFDQAKDFMDGLALVSEGTSARYLDMSGAVIFSSVVPGFAASRRAPCSNVSVIR